MAPLKPITIIGGGLAGLSLGIGLRQKGVPVTVWEAGRYPRHRVCGEFISGRGQEALARLGLREALFKAGAVPAHTAAFFLHYGSSPARPLPMPAWCLSRFTLDALLAEVFRQHGGQLRESERWSGKEYTEGMVRASGRRVQATERGWRWLGMKLHARNLPLTADLEMHAVPNGYVGLCRLNDGEVNVCGVFRRALGSSDTLPTRQEFMRGFPAQGGSGDTAQSFEQQSIRAHPIFPPLLLGRRGLGRGGSSPCLSQRLAHALLDESSFCSVAGIALRPQRALHHPECCVGDALTMIPPVTGNGMSMAFEAADLAVEPLFAYSRGEIPWGQARETVARQCDQAFARRLVWAKWLHWMMLSPLFQSPLGVLALNSTLLWRYLFERTR